MAEKSDSGALRFVVLFLRNKVRMGQEEFGRAVRVSQSQISQHELGKTDPPDDVLRRMARIADVPWHVVMLLRRFLAVALSAEREAEEAAPMERAVLDSALMAAMPYLVELAEKEERQDPEELVQEAEEIWSALEPLPEDERRRRIETAPQEACRSWAALAKRVGEESERAADDGEAGELARLAELIAGRA